MPGMWVALHILSVLLVFGASVAQDEDPVVEMPLGKVRGHTATSRSGRKFLAFSGMPYAKPPLGDLRFQAPEAPALWRGIKDAKKDGPICLQYSPFMAQNNIMGDEDCLYLTVFTHDITRKAPVLVHFHGGAFTMGYSGYYGPEYLMDEDIVVVNVNYRLGIFGFLTFETPELPGNQGMKDQVMSLRWVKQNIESFGGDPNQVTIIGESAGGASVYHHIISPLSRGLFHRAISESGTSYSLWALAPPGFPRSTAEKLMKLINCPTKAEEAIPCLIKKDANEIITQIPHFLEWKFHPFLYFGPSIEAPGANSFIVGGPSKWDHNPVPLIMGMTSAEGLMETASYLTKDFDFKWLTENYNRLAPFFLEYFASASNPDEITKEVRKYYLPNEELTIKDFVNLTMAYSDSVFTVSVLDGANKHKGDVYFYYFDLKTPIPGVEEKYNIGATHCAEASFLWNINNPGFPTLKFDSFLTDFSKKLVKVVTSFVKKGTPIVEGLTWKKWTAKSNNFVQIDNKGYHQKTGLAEDRYKFWNSINFRDKMDK